MNDWIDRVEEFYLDCIFYACVRTLAVVAPLVAMWCVGVVWGW